MASAIPVPRANSSDSKGLAKNSVGQLGSLASSIGIQAPAAGIALVPSVMAATVGRSGPLAFLIGIVAGLFVSYVYVRLTRHYVNAGANYTFAGIMLGPAVGFIVAWGWIFMGVTNAAGTISQASDYGAYALSQMGIHLFTHGAWWIVLGVLAWALIMYLSYLSISASVRVLLIIEGVACLVVVIVGVIVLAKGGYNGHNFTFSYFGLHGLKLSSLAFGVAISFLGFGGFEAAAFVGEESKLARRQVPVAIVGSLLFSGLMYAFGSWFLSVGFKSTSALAASATPLFTVASNEVNSGTATLLAFLTAFSAFASSLALTSALLRISFALTRDGFVSKSLAVTHPKYKSPYKLLAVYSVPILACVVGFAWTSAGEAFALVTTTGAYFFTVTYLIISIGGLWFYNRDRSTRSWHSIVFPLVSAGITGYALYSSVYPPAPFPFNILPWIALTWLVIGVLIIACSHGLRAKLAASPMFRARYSPIGTPGERSTVALVPADSPEVAAS